MDYRREIAQEIVAAARAGAAARVIARGPTRWPFGPGQAGHRRGRARRGDVRVVILALLAERPSTGYGIMEALEERSGGAWRPSPGAVYPTLEQLVADGLVVQETHEGAKLFALTPEGKRYVKSNRESLDARCAAIAGAGAEGIGEFRATVAQLMVAVFQVAQAGNATQRQQARRVLSDARRGLYRILAEAEDDALEGDESVDTEETT